MKCCEYGPWFRAKFDLILNFSYSSSLADWAKWRNVNNDLEQPLTCLKPEITVAFT